MGTKTTVAGILRQVRAQLPRVVKALGLVAALIAIYQFFPRTPAVEIDLVPSSDQIVLGSGDLDANLPVVADTVAIAEPLVATKPLRVITNHLLFGDSGSLVGPEITIFATRISGGRIGATGAPGRSPGEQGAPGGSIAIAAARIDGTTIEAAGGSGADGANGADGAGGRNGDCAGFGRWVGATNGGNGQDGTGGSRGGDGGQITLFLAEDDGFPEPNVSGGRGGAPGQGGRGGPGGTGCTGLGGSQSSHPDGRDGRDGTLGLPGELGTLVQRRIRFRDVSEALENVDLADESALVAVMNRL